MLVFNLPNQFFFLTHKSLEHQKFFGKFCFCRAMNELPAFLTMKISTNYNFIIYFVLIVIIRFVLTMFYKISDYFTAKIILK